ncbi:MAG TPA: HD domain-containing protein [Blastocatellia bacterium]|nr:HD domain-containing protein [Blastocatellia bacterium]
MTSEEFDLPLIFKALKFSADKHRNQRRKDGQASPYINHPIDVAEILCRVGQVRDTNVLIAAILHDTIEDTDTTPDEIEAMFGSAALAMVLEVTDDKRLPKQARKQLQIEMAPHKSDGAKLIKLADKISNLHDIANSPPADWPLQRKIEYLDWTERVVAGLRGVNKNLEDFYDETLRMARAKVGGQG